MARIKYYDSVAQEWAYADMAVARTYSTATVTLAAADWNSNTQTVTVNGVTATNLVMVAPAPSDYTAYGTANIRATAQATDSLTFECDTTPSADIDVNVAIWG